jgi:3-methylfumaryl-CoA hydratase
MWASSKVEFLAPLVPGVAIERISRIASVTEKQGASGSLAFVEVAHETRSAGEVAVREVQSLVYRAAAASDAPLSPPPPGEGCFESGAWQVHRTLTPSEALLFRFSALTFNTHRIHYDAPYAREVERYRGLVVHGPLMATLLLDLARRELGDNALRSFAFRAQSPAICGEELHLVMRQKDEGLELGAFAADGRQVVGATATA